MTPWRWTNARVAMLCLWSFLLGANLVRLAGAIDARERWLGAGLGMAVAGAGIVLGLRAAR